LIVQKKGKLFEKKQIFKYKGMLKINKARFKKPGCPEISSRYIIEFACYLL